MHKIGEMNKGRDGDRTHREQVSIVRGKRDTKRKSNYKKKKTKEEGNIRETIARDREIELEKSSKKKARC